MYVIVTIDVNWQREFFSIRRGKKENTGNLKMQFEWVSSFLLFLHFDLSLVTGLTGIKTIILTRFRFRVYVSSRVVAVTHL